MNATAAIAKENGIPVVLDASLCRTNLYFIKTREAACRDMSILDITLAMSKKRTSSPSPREAGFARGGGIA
jgi:tryptophanase